METNLQVLNKISQKLGGEADATSVTESLNNIANALGDTNPDVIKSVSDSLNDILEYAGGGGGGSLSNPNLHITLTYTGTGGGMIFPLGFDYADIISDGKLQDENGSVGFGETGEATIIVKYYPAEYSWTSEEAYYYAGGPQSWVNAGAVSTSDAVNCTYDEDNNLIMITDPSADASIHVTVTRE